MQQLLIIIIKAQSNDLHYQINSLITAWLIQIMNKKFGRTQKFSLKNTFETRSREIQGNLTSYHSTQPVGVSHKENLSHLVFRKVPKKEQIRAQKLALVYCIRKSFVKKINTFALGPSEKQMSSIQNHNRQKMSEIQQAISRRSDGHLRSMATHYCRSIGLPQDSKIFIFNSKDVHIKEALQRAGWILNPDSTSRIFHLKWSYKDNMQDYSSLLPGQLFNHFNGSLQITTKDSLYKNLKEDIGSQLNSIMPVSLTCSESDKILQTQKSYNQLVDLNMLMLQYKRLRQEGRVLLSQKFRIKLQKYFICEDLLEINQELVKKLKKKLKKACLNWEGIRGLGLKNIWILKPSAKSKGVGIKLIRGLNSSSLTNFKDHVVQKYIQNPFLLNAYQDSFFNNRKFDIRQWVLLTNNPQPTVFRFKDFYLRFCSQQYHLDNFNSYSHLTNFTRNKNAMSDVTKSILMSRSFQKYLEGNCHVNFQQKIVQQIDRIIMRVMKTAIPKINFQSGCFQLFGFDIMLDMDLHAWLLQVNMSPACEARSVQLQSCLQEMSEGIVDLIEKKESKNWMLVNL